MPRTPPAQSDGLRRGSVTWGSTRLPLRVAAKLVFEGGVAASAPLPPCAAESTQGCWRDGASRPFGGPFRSLGWRMRSKPLAHRCVCDRLRH